MASQPDSPRQLVIWTVAVVALTAVALWSLYLARHVLLLLYVSALFAMGVSPLVRLIERQKLLRVGARGMPRALAVLLIYGTVLLSLTIVGLTIMPPLVRQARELWNRLPEMFDAAQRWLVGLGVLATPLTLRDVFQHAPATGTTDAVSGLVGAVSGFVGGVVGLVSILILTFYLLLESDQILAAFVRLFPEPSRARAAEVGRHAAAKVSAWLGGQLLLAAIIGTTAATGLGLMGVPYISVLALMAAVGELIPVIGPVLAALPAIAVALTVSVKLAVGVAVFFFVQQQFENYVLVPKIMQRQVGVSAVTVIIALLVGSSLLGIAGAILAVPTAAILQVVVQEITRRGE